MAAEPARWHFTDDRLENGLRVLTVEDHRAPLASVQVWYHVGSKDEDPNRQGFAHMFEHMMFRGTDRIGPQDHFKYLDRYGARVNGYTNFDTTVYWETLPASQLDLALWLEAERMGHLKINEDYFAAEREVVKEERRMRYLNRPYGKLYETLFSAAFTVHPYRWTPIGNMPHLDASTADELRAFFQKYYIPCNATLVVAGDVRRGDVLAKAREYFAAIPRGEAPPRVQVIEPPMGEPRRIEITDRAPSPRIEIAFHAPSERDPDSIPLSMLSRILSGGQSSRLYRHLVSGKRLAVNAYAYDYLLEQAGLFIFSMTLKPEVSIEEGEKALLEEVHLLLKEGIHPDELRKAKNQMVSEYVRQSETVQGRADQLGYAAVVLGDPQRVNTDLDRKRQVTVEHVMAIARRVFTDKNRVTIIIRPEASPPPAEEAAKDKSAKSKDAITDLPPPKEMPTGRTPQPVDLPVPDLRKLANGLHVVVFRDPSVPAVTVSFNALIGSKDDPPDLGGLATVTANTLRRGTRAHGADDLAERIDSRAMDFSESVSATDTTLKMWALSEHLDTAAETLAEVVRQPVFPDDEIRSYVARAAAREAIDAKDPSTVASRVLARTLYENHYLARPAGGTAESLKRIDRAAVVDFHHRFYTPDTAYLIFSGDITSDRAFALANRWFGDWNGKGERTASVPPPSPVPTHVCFVDRPESTQSEIRIGQVVPLTREDPDYPAVRLLSQIFGESFSGRLNRSLRIEKGLTYGAFAAFDVSADAAAFRISTFTRTERTVEAIRAALAEVQRLQATEVTRDELEQARDTLIGRFQMALETPAQAASRYWDLIVWRLPESWYTNYLRGVARVNDPQALKRVAAAKLDPARMTIVVVGRGSTIEADLDKVAPLQRVAD